MSNIILNIPQILRKESLDQQITFDSMTAAQLKDILDSSNKLAILYQDTQDKILGGILKDIVDIIAQGLHGLRFTHSDRSVTTIKEEGSSYTCNPRLFFDLLKQGYSTDLARITSMSYHNSNINLFTVPAHFNFMLSRYLEKKLFQEKNPNYKDLTESVLGIKKILVINI